MSGSTERHYGSPASFRRALTDRLRTMAADRRWTLPHLQRQVAYDRLLQRLYVVDDAWVVKGATALMARDLGARATIDIDLYRLTVTRSAENDLRAAAERDLGDWFRFDIGPVQPMKGSTDLSGVASGPALVLPRLPERSERGQQSSKVVRCFLVGGQR